MSARPLLVSFPGALLLWMLLLACATPWAQDTGKTVSDNKGETPKDTLGRETPKGAVLGFLDAARKGNNEIAVLYLNTPLRGQAAQTLGHELAVVLDRKLPARLNELSDKPEGSIPDPLKPDEDLIGTIPTADGDLNIMVERVDRGKMGRVWVFSSKTLGSIPQVYKELSTPLVEQILPGFLVDTRLVDIPLFEWVAVFIGVPVAFILTGLLNKGAAAAAGAVRRRLARNPHAPNPQVLSPPIRLLIVAGVILFLLSRVGLPLLARQFWSTFAKAMMVVGCVWLMLLLNGAGERYFLRRSRSMSGSASVLRLIRRAADGLVLAASVLLVLNHFDVNITAALAGLGVGGIAVALAAQKTLENVIAGISLIADQAVRVGDTLKLGEIVGTVEEVGLRSTRIRTIDRTLVSVPNGQIANMTVEALSARDKFWFRHIIGLRYDTTATQLSFITEGIGNLLAHDLRIEKQSVRIRVLRLAPYSIDIEVCAYVMGPDWNYFLEVQEELLLVLKSEIEKAGAEIAFPSQTLYLSDHSSASGVRSKVASVSPRTTH